MGMDEEINIGVVEMGKMGIRHTEILSSLDGMKVKAFAAKQDFILKEREEWYDENVKG
jgi:hypothetical protein